MHQTSDTEEAMVTEFKKKKKKKYRHCFQISRLHCPRAQKDTTQYLQGALAAILSLPSLVTMVCAFDSTYSCAHFGHACSMTLQVELMQKTNGKENCHGSCGSGSSNLTLLDCLQKLTKSTPIDSFLHGDSATILHQMTRSHSHIAHQHKRCTL